VEQGGGKWSAGKLKDQWSKTAKWTDSKQHTRIDYDVLGRVKGKSIVDRKAYYATAKKGHSYHWYTFKYGDKNAPAGTKGKLIEAYASYKLNGTDLV